MISHKYKNLLHTKMPFDNSPLLIVYHRFSMWQVITNENENKLLQPGNAEIGIRKQIPIHSKFILSYYGKPVKKQNTL